jgi:D-3-phosphoglycerate dehydrogenase
MKKINVAVTIRSFNKDNLSREGFMKRCEVSFFNATGRRLSENELIRALDGADAVIAGTEHLGENVFAACPCLRIISRVGVGVDNIDLEAAKKNHVIILSTPEAPVQAVAEHTIALLLSLMKHIPMYNVNVRNGNFTLTAGSLLCGKTAGIVGMGRIGKKVASILTGFGCRILYYDPFVQNSIPESWERLERLEDLMSRSDILSLHSPPQPDGSPIITAELMTCSRRGMIIINTSRGSVLDEQALMHGLDSGVISGAGLDVFSVEPYTGPLLKYPQVIVTPHVSSNTTESRDQMETDAMDNLLTAIEGVMQ